MSPPKIVLIVVWLLLASGFFASPESTIAGYARMLFWAMAAVHVVECAVFFPKLKAAPGSLAGHLVQVFFFGVAHMRELDQAQSQSAA